VAAIYGTDLAEMHRLLPVWIIPLLTFTVVGWVCLLLKATNPARSSQAAMHV